MEIFGRKQELFELQKAWAVALGGRPRVVIIEGPAGVGKTHLSGAFLDQIRHQKTTEEPTRIAHATAREGCGEAAPLGVLWDALARLVGSGALAGATTDFEAFAAVERLAGCLPVEHLPELAVQLGRFWHERGGYPHADLSPARLLRDTLVAAFRRGPVALFLDDIAFADPASLELLTRCVDILVESGEPAQLLVVLATDPGVAGRRGVVDVLRRRIGNHERPDNRIVSTLKLRGLGRSALRSLVTREAAGARLEDTTLTDWLSDDTDGNAADARDLVRGMLGCGFLTTDSAQLVLQAELDRGADGWQVGSRLAHWLDGLCDQPRLRAAAAAMDALADDDRRLLAVASLCADAFSVAMLGSVTGRSELEVAARLAALARQEIVEPIDGVSLTATLGGDLYRLSRANYVSVLRHRLSPVERRLWHGRIANHLLLRRGEWRDRHERATALGERDIPEHRRLADALHAVGRALAQHLAAARRPVEAARFIAQWLDQTAYASPPDDPFWAAAHARRLLQTCWQAEQLLMSLEASRLADAGLDLRRACAEAALAAGRARRSTGHVTAGLALAGRALEAAEQLDDAELRAQASCEQLALHYVGGDHQRARQCFEALVDGDSALGHWQLGPMLEVFERYEHPLVSAHRLEQLGEALSGAGQGRLAQAIDELVLRSHGEALVDRWLAGQVGEDDLVEVTRQARASGHGPAVVDMLAGRLADEACAERARLARLQAAPVERAELVAEAGRLVAMSQRLRGLAELAAAEADAQADAQTAAAVRADLARLDSLWHRVGHQLLDGYDAQGSHSLPDALRRLRDAVDSGPLNPAALLATLESAVALADRAGLVRAQLTVRLHLLDRDSLDREQASRHLDQLDQLARTADDPLAELFVVAGRAARSRAEGHPTKAQALFEGVEESANRLYAATEADDRKAIAALMVALAAGGPAAIAADRWIERALELNQTRPAAADFVAPVELAAAAAELRDDASMRMDQVRRLVGEVEHAIAHTDPLHALDTLDQLDQLVAGDGETAPLRSRLAQMRAEANMMMANDADVSAVSVYGGPAVDAAVEAGQLAAGVGQKAQSARLLGLAVTTAAGHAPKRFWPLAEAWFDEVDALGNLALLDASFERACALVDIVRGASGFDEADVARLEDRIAGFVGDQTRRLHQLGAASLLERWDSQLSRMSDQTKLLPFGR